MQAQHRTGRGWCKKYSFQPFSSFTLPSKGPSLYLCYPPVSIKVWLLPPNLSFAVPYRKHRQHRGVGVVRSLPAFTAAVILSYPWPWVCSNRYQPERNWAGEQQLRANTSSPFPLSLLARSICSRPCLLLACLTLEHPLPYYFKRTPSHVPLQ